MTNETPKIKYAGHDRKERNLLAKDWRIHHDINHSTLVEYFRRGLNTQEIARRFYKIRESDVYNMLAQAREAERAG